VSTVLTSGFDDADPGGAMAGMAGLSLRIGALVPLTPPGWVEAGRHLLAGLELAVRDVNDGGGVHGRPLELVVRDTAADPGRAAAAVDELAGLGVAALAGEYHSVVARAAAARADARGLPFLCSSAVLDALTDRPSDVVARLAPPQSRGWGVYAGYLRDAGHARVAAVTQPSVYWESGIRVLREQLDVVELDPAAVCDELAASGATALLLLVGHPEPAMSVVTSVRADERLAGVLVGAPAGQPELAGWAAAGVGIPFLRYLPRQPGALGERVGTALRERLSGPPSFVAWEGYDTVLVLAEKLRSGLPWPEVAVAGTRGAVRFTRPPGVPVWQWTWPPVQVAVRNPASPDGFEVLYTG
jgi:ABC-type branched-subunit amino acid transport system substrate-binding protein